MKDRAGRSLLEIAFTWALIAGAIALAVSTDSAPLRFLLFLTIASRQYALIVLHHEAFHGLLAVRPRLNDAIAKFLLAFPLGSTFEVSRKKHLAHHRLLGQKEDPDFVWYEVGEIDGVVGIFRYLLAVPSRQVSYTYATKADEAPIKRANLAWVGTYQIFLLVSLTRLGGWTTYPLFWVMPLFVAVLLDKVRSFCEHTSSLPANSLPVVRTFRSGRVERFFLAPFHMNFHAEHHRFPNVPHYRLPEFSERLREREHGTHYRTEGSYLTILWRNRRRFRVPA